MEQPADLLNDYVEVRIARDVQIATGLVFRKGQVTLAHRTDTRGSKGPVWQAIKLNPTPGRWFTTFLDDASVQTIDFS